MLKLLKGFVYLFAAVGAVAVGYLLYLGALKAKEEWAQPAGSPQVAEAKPATPAGTAPAPVSAPEIKPPADPALASIVQNYQKQVAPAPQAGEGATSPGSPSSYQQSLAAKPVRTPGPDTKIIRSWPTGRKWVALTYDDGPHPEHTPKLMDLLKSKNVKATFFVLGPMVEKSPEVAKALAEAGFEIANHTVNHKEFRRMSKEQIREEIDGATKIIKEVTGTEPKVMRPPYGQAPKNVQEVTDELGLRIVTWNVDTEDWKRAPAEKMRDTILKNVSDGAIILMHDTHGERVYDATAQVIDEVRAKGYEFVTVSELLGLTPYTPAGSAPAGAPAQAAGSMAAATPAVEVAAAPAPAAAAEPAPASPAGQDPMGLPAPSAQPGAERKLPEVSPDKLTTAN